MISENLNCLITIALLGFINIMDGWGRDAFCSPVIQLCVSDQILNLAQLQDLFEGCETDINPLRITPDSRKPVFSIKVIKC